MATESPSVPVNLLDALTGSVQPHLTSASSSSLVLPVPSASYLVSLSRDHTPSPMQHHSTPLDEPTPTSNRNRSFSLAGASAGPSHQYPEERRSDSESVGTRTFDDSPLRMSEDGGHASTVNRDSTRQSSNAGGPLRTVSEHDPTTNSRRASNALTFGPADDGPESRGPSVSMDRNHLTPDLPLASLALPPANTPHDQPKRQSARSSKLSREDMPESEKDRFPDKKDRPSDEGGVRSGSFHRLTLKTTNDSSTGYAGYGSSNGHGEFGKKGSVLFGLHHSTLISDTSRVM